MKAIWKFCINPWAMVSLHQMPRGSTPLHVNTQGDDMFLWAAIDTEAEQCRRRIVIVGTGSDSEAHDGLPYIGTVHLGRYVWHVFDGGEERA